MKYYVSMKNAYLIHSGAVWSVVKLDRERKSQHNFRVLAEDMGTPRRKSTCQVQINIIDENDETPRFPEPSYQINVQENLAVGALIGIFFHLFILFLCHSVNG